MTLDVLPLAVTKDQLNSYTTLIKLNQINRMISNKENIGSIRSYIVNNKLESLNLDTTDINTLKNSI
jgi:hypothetical protein